jgi:AcrR family transcriptional regulator
MELLWGQPAKRSRGPKPATDLPTIVRAAIELADSGGLEAVSMRRVAERLGLGTMSLYTYVPGKAELLDLMLDTVYGERLGHPVTDAPSRRAALEALARDLWDFHHRHPWTLYIAASRAVLGPNETASYESALSVAAALDVPAREVVAIVDALSMYVRGAARDAVEAATAEGVTGVSEMEWWSERDAILTEKMGADAYPTLARLEAEGAFAVPDDTANYNLRFILDDFEFGLQRLLDGIEASVAASRPGIRRR